MDALRFCGSDRGGPRQAVCIHRYARVRASKSKEGAKPVVRETSLREYSRPTNVLTYLHPQGGGAVELRAISLHLPQLAGTCGVRDVSHPLRRAHRTIGAVAHPYHRAGTTK